jgi:outer membrane receptor protein involved in Fe transport
LYAPAGASVYHYGAQVYHDVSVGYNIEPLNTTVQLGVDNLSDKQPPLFFQQNVINANTDVNTYDTVGRYYFAKVTVKF